MQKHQFNTLKGLKVNIGIYETYDEADKAAGRANAMLKEGNFNLAYRGVLPEARDRIVTIVERETGIAPKSHTETKDGKEVLVWDESDGKYVSRVCAEKGWDDLSSLQPIVDLEVSDLAVDITEPERKPSKPKTLPESYLNAAKGIMARGKVDALSAKLKAESGTVVPALTGDEAKDAQALGWAIKANEDAKRRAEEAKRQAEYGNL